MAELETRAVEPGCVHTCKGEMNKKDKISELLIAHWGKLLNNSVTRAIYPHYNSTEKV